MLDEQLTFVENRLKTEAELREMEEKMRRLREAPESSATSSTDSLKSDSILRDPYPLLVEQTVENMVDQEIQVSNITKTYQSKSMSSQYIKNRIDSIIGEKADKITEIFEKMMMKRDMVDGSFQASITP